MLKSQNTAETAKSLPVDDDESLHSYDLSALFTNVPGDQVLRGIKDRLDSGSTWSPRTSLTSDIIVKLLSECLNFTYFCFK